MHLLYVANKSLSELRQLYFKIKDRVFGSDRFGFAYNTEALEHLLKDEFGTSMRMDSVTTPKYAIGMNEFGTSMRIDVHGV